MKKTTEPVCMCGHLKRDHGPVWCKFFGTGCICKSFTDTRISARRAASNETREAGPKKAIIDLLEKRGIRYFRMQSGSSHIRQGNHITLNKKGTPDILFIGCSCIGICKKDEDSWCASHSHIVWVEVKKSDGKQSPEQVAFQKEAESHGETYILARSAQDVDTFILSNSF